MKINLRIMALVALMIGSGTGARATPIATLFSTGVNSSNVELPFGSIDSHYTILRGPTKVVTSLATVDAATIPGWAPDDSLSEWVGPNSDSKVSGPAGIYQYRTSFNLTGLDATTAVITGTWAASSKGTNVYVNNVRSGSNTAGQASLTNFTINSGFLPGLNTLDFYTLNNVAGTSTGLRVELSGTATSVPEPASLVVIAPAFLALGFLRQRRRDRRLGSLDRLAGGRGITSS